MQKLKIELEKVIFESKDAQIINDSLKEANQEMAKEIEDLKRRLGEAKQEAAVESEMERKRKMISDMMSEYSSTSTDLSTTLPVELIEPAQIQAMHTEFIECKNRLLQYEKSSSCLTLNLKSMTEERDRVNLEKLELEAKLLSLTQGRCEVISFTLLCFGMLRILTRQCLPITKGNAR